MQAAACCVPAARPAVALPQHCCSPVGQAAASPQRCRAPTCSHMPPRRSPPAGFLCQHHRPHQAAEGTGRRGRRQVRRPAAVTRAPAAGASCSWAVLPGSGPAFCLRQALRRAPACNLPLCAVDALDVREWCGLAPSPPPRCRAQRAGPCTSRSLVSRHTAASICKGLGLLVSPSRAFGELGVPEGGRAA